MSNGPLFDTAGAAETLVDKTAQQPTPTATPGSPAPVKTDAPGTGSPPGAIPSPEQFQQATEKAFARLEKHKSGRPRGRPRKLPVAEMGNSPGAAPVPPAPQPDLGQPSDKIIDFETSAHAAVLARALVSAGDRLVQTIGYVGAKAWTRDDETAQAARKLCAMEDEERESLMLTSPYMLEKHFGKIEDPREAAFWVIVACVLVRVAGVLLDCFQSQRRQRMKAPAQPQPEPTPAAAAA